MSKIILSMVIMLGLSLPVYADIVPKYTVVYSSNTDTYDVKEGRMFPYEGAFGITVYTLVYDKKIKGFSTREKAESYKVYLIGRSGLRTIDTDKDR